MLLVLFLVSHFKFLFVPCGELSWLPVSFLLHVKYTLSYRIVSYLESVLRKLGSVAVLRSLSRILRASLAQIRKWPRYSKLTEKFAKLGKAAKFPAYTISEEGILFRHPDYDPDRAQKLISSSMSRLLSTRNISSKSMHAFLSNLAHRQTDIQIM